MKLFIIGFMGSGKTLIAKMLGDMLNLQCIDLDKCIERDSNRTINKIFKTNGEVYFRQLENEQIIKILRGFMYPTFMMKNGPDYLRLWLPVDVLRCTVHLNR